VSDVQPNHHLLNAIHFGSPEYGIDLEYHAASSVRGERIVKVMMGPRETCNLPESLLGILGIRNRREYRLNFCGDDRNSETCVNGQTFQ
jgi:hypothetical protein